MGTIVGWAFIFMGVMMMVTLLKDKNNNVSTVILVSGFFILMGLGLWGGVISSIIYLKKKKQQFMTEFFTDELTAMYSDRDGAAETLWWNVKIFTQTLPLWSKYKLEYNRFYLQKYQSELERYR